MAALLPLAFLKHQRSGYKIADVVVMCLKVSSTYDNSLKTIKNTSEARRLELSSLVIKFLCTCLARSWTHSMDRQSSLHEDIFEICKWIWILLFFRFGKGICSHVSSQGVQDPFQMFFVNSLMHHALLCFAFLPLVQVFSCISSHGNLGIFRSLLRCAKNSWRKTIFAR